MFNDITNWESRKVHDNCPAQAREVPTYAARFRSGYLSFCGSGSGKPWTRNEVRPAHQFANGEWDQLALRMTSKLVTSKTSRVQVFQHSSNKCGDEARARGREGREGKGWHAFQKRASKSSHARENDLRVQSNLFITRSEKWIRKIGSGTRCQFRFKAPFSN